MATEKTTYMTPEMDRLLTRASQELEQDPATTKYDWVGKGKAQAKRIEALEARCLLLEGYLNGALNVIESFVACDTSEARAALKQD